MSSRESKKIFDLFRTVWKNFASLNHDLDSSCNSSFIILGECRSALGMEEGRIPDHAITASSSYEIKSVGPQNARLLINSINL